MGSIKLVLLTVLSAAVATGCSTTGTFRPVTEKRAVRTELYFGEISDKLWKSFLANEVTPRFPDGLTWFPAEGQWREKNGAISHEKSRVLVLIHAGAKTDEAKIEAIRSRFVTKFGHESVLKVTTPAWVAF